MSEFHPRLQPAREAAWEQIPIFGQLRVRLTWKRQGCTPLWIVETAGPEPGKKRLGFDIVGGMYFYVVHSEIAACAPPPILQTIYGCLFAHTARFAFSSRKTILQNGNLNVPLLPSWPQTLLQARRWQFDVDRLRSWLDQDHATST